MIPTLARFSTESHTGSGGWLVVIHLFVKGNLGEGKIMGFKDRFMLENTTDVNIETGRESLKQSMILTASSFGE